MLRVELTKYAANAMLAPKISFMNEGLARLQLLATKEEATEGANALVICTEWKRFMAPNFDHLASALRHKLIFDGRNLYDPERLAELGWTYYAIGRGASVQAVV